jgi:hypothetical protein
LEIIMIRFVASTCLPTALVCALLSVPACGDDGSSGETDSGTMGGEQTTGASAGSSASGGSNSGTMGEEPTTGSGHGEGGATCVATVDLNRSTRETTCKCAVENQSFPDFDSCMVEFGWWQGQYEAKVCDCELTAAYPDAAANLECLLDAAEEYEACLAKTSCAAAEEQNDCAAAYVTAQSACPIWQQPAEQQAKSQIECHGEQPFTCGSGEVIPESWVCNKQSNCTDMSDEASCS